MIYKVLYQEQGDIAPVREHTKCLYVEAESERDARDKIADRAYNIELIQKLEGKHLAYEQASELFEIESV
ncbi:MAG TPA: DNA-directed RNA polymerase subunit epsilon [Pseudogracilibacillus sp.]|nr:DNA-directed RNA polymerase subunit epsilon [Pseudogracilibacillus sp.]